MFFGGDPFEHFGHNGGGGRARRAGSTSVDSNKLYETLGVSKLPLSFFVKIDRKPVPLIFVPSLQVDKSADEKEIKKAYRKLA